MAFFGVVGRKEDTIDDDDEEMRSFLDILILSFWRILLCSWQRHKEEESRISIRIKAQRAVDEVLTLIIIFGNKYLE